MPVDKRKPGKKPENTPEEVISQRRRRLADIEEIKSFFGRLVFFAVFIWVLFFRIFGLKSMPNDDMSPRLSAGDLMLYYRLQTRWRADDIVIFQKDGKQYTGRLIAMGGDKVDISEDGVIRINDSAVGESEIFYTTKPYDNGISFPVQLGQDQFFILCDYREGAADSREFGPVNRNEIMGKVITVIRRSDL